MPTSKIHANMVASIRQPIQHMNDDQTEYNLCLKLKAAWIHVVDSILVFCMNGLVSRLLPSKSENHKRNEEGVFKSNNFGVWPFIIYHASYFPLNLANQ